MLHGLGGRDVLQELRALDFYKRGVEHLGDLPVDRQPDPVQQLVMQQIAAQRITSAGSNFRHGGGVYLTPSRHSAERYASEFGSELLQECRVLYENIQSASVGQAPGWFDEFSQLILCLANPGEQLLIRIDGVSIEELIAEDGTDARAVANVLLVEIAENREKAERRESLRRAAQAGDSQAMMELLKHTDAWTTEQIIETLGQQSNFQALVTFPASRLEFLPVSRTD